MDIDAGNDTLSELDAVRQEHETFLSQLEAYAVIGIATDDWNSFYEHVSAFHRQQVDTASSSLDGND